MTLRTLLAMILAAILYSGCTSVPKRMPESPADAKAYQDRLQQLQPVTRWELEARLAISNSSDGGSGSLKWAQDDQITRMSFHGALGRGAWQLEADSSGARLQLANGSVEHATSVAELVLHHVGWKVPVEALAWWIKGLADPDGWEQRELDEQGRLKSLSQFGWDVAFDQYDEAGGFWLPAKLTARRGDYRIKMVVRKWHLGEGVTAFD